HVCVFVFSSRRRHTRSKRDWSSDVCSSDLAICWRPAADSSSRPSLLIPELRMKAPGTARRSAVLIFTNVLLLQVCPVVCPYASKIGRASCRERVERNRDTRHTDWHSCRVHHP